MEEIKVGEYVRTDNGIIGMYAKYRGVEDTIETNNKFIGFDIEKDIIKHSFNIIDLIKEGDYVNGKEVVYDADAGGMYNGHKTIDVSISNDNSTTWTIIDTEIKSIVTHEQFNQMKYIVGDE